MTELTSNSGPIYDYVLNEFGYDLVQDFPRVGRLAPHVVQLDPINGPLQHITDASGADYYAARIDYGDDEIGASRAFAVVMNGARTKLAYYPKDAQAKKLHIAKGEGWLIIGDPQTEDNLDDIEQTKYYMINANVTPEITLQPGSFYTFEAATGDQPLVVTGLSTKDADNNWEDADEIQVEPGTDNLIVPGEGMLLVPEEFIDAAFN